MSCYDGKSFMSFTEKPINTIVFSSLEDRNGNLWVGSVGNGVYKSAFIIKRMKAFLNGELPSNYHLTFSCSETNEKIAKLVLEMGGNVAVVFRNQLPDTWNGVEVVDGDESDLRFLDKKGVVVGLIEKGLAKKDLTGFVKEGINS